MSTAARRKPATILVSEDYDPGVWETLDGEESAFQAWVAVAQDIWGRSCFAPGQADAARQAAAALTINKTMIVGAAGCGVGGVGRIASEAGAHIEVFESDAALLAHAAADPGPAGKLLRVAALDPAQPDLRADRYHALMALRAVSASPDPFVAAKALAAAVKPGGRLFVDELFVADPSVAALIAQGIAGPNQKLALHAQAPVFDTLKNQKLEPRARTDVGEQLMADIRAGLAKSVGIAQRLKEIPKPFRKPRMSAFADELQRAAVLHQALEKGLVTAVRTLHYKTREL